MKKYILILCLIIVANRGLACTCGSFEPNFYKTISTNHQTYIAVFDSMEIKNNEWESPSEVGYFIIIDTITHTHSAIGDTIVVWGHNVGNCSQSLSEFNSGDTVALNLTLISQTDSPKDTFNLYACGVYMLKVSNCESNQLSIQEIKDKVHLVLDNLDLRCNCDAIFPHYDFFYNINQDSPVCMAVFHGYDYSYSYNNFTSQTGYFEVIETLENMTNQPGDTIVVLGEDGINCGEILHRFLPGDTVFMILSEGYYESFESDTFYLKSSKCGNFVLKVSNGQSNGLSIAEIKANIISIISSIENWGVKNQLTIYPNPANEKLTISSDNDLIKDVMLYNTLGQMIKSINNIHKLDTDIDVKNISPGIYSVLVKTANGHSVYQILKN
jgi:hypothetical protein